MEQEHKQSDDQFSLIYLDHLFKTKHECTQSVGNNPQLHRKTACMYYDNYSSLKMF